MRHGYFTGRYYLDDPSDKARTFRYCPCPVMPLTYHAADGRVFAIDRHFETDGATTGRILGAIPGLGQWDWKRAAILHDWLWEQRRTGTLAANFWESNKLLEEAILALGWNRWIAFAARVGCTLFGWVWWLRGERSARG